MTLNYGATAERALLNEQEPIEQEMENIIKKTAAIAIRFVTGKHRSAAMNDASFFFSIQSSVGLSLKDRLTFILFYTKKEFWKEEAEAFVRSYLLEHDTEGNFTEFLSRPRTRVGIV